MRYTTLITGKYKSADEKKTRQSVLGCDSEIYSIAILYFKIIEMNNNSVITAELNNKEMTNVIGILLPSVVEFRETAPESSSIMLNSLRK